MVLPMLRSFVEEFVEGTTSGFPPQEVLVKVLRSMERGLLVGTKSVSAVQRLSLELPIRLVLLHAWVG